jgi:hypothetical protein
MLGRGAGTFTNEVSPSHTARGVLELVARISLERLVRKERIHASARRAPFLRFLRLARIVDSAVRGIPDAPATRRW